VLLLPTLLLDNNVPPRIELKLREAVNLGTMEIALDVVVLY
jgi:hypothetical protein